MRLSYLFVLNVTAKWKLMSKANGERQRQRERGRWDYRYMLKEKNSDDIPVPPFLNDSSEANKIM